MTQSAIKALTFDVFGTVTDWRSTIIREGRQLGLRIAELVQEPLDAAQRQVDDLGVKLEEALQDGGVTAQGFPPAPHPP